MVRWKVAACPGLQVERSCTGLVGGEAWRSALAVVGEIWSLPVNILSVASFTIDIIGGTDGTPTGSPPSSGGFIIAAAAP